MGPIRIFIGTDESQVVPTAVLRHSITSRTDAAVKFHELTDLKTGLEQDFYTGFSFYRWGIPSFCNYTGSAIYLDTDIVVLCDIRELWDLDMGDHSHLCRPPAGVPAPQVSSQPAWRCVRLRDTARLRALLGLGFRGVVQAGRGRSEVLHTGDVVPQRHLDRSRSRCPPHGVQRSRPPCPGPDQDHSLHRPAQSALEEARGPIRRRLSNGVVRGVRGRRRATGDRPGRNRQWTHPRLGGRLVSGRLMDETGRAHD